MIAQDARWDMTLERFIQSEFEPQAARQILNVLDAPMPRGRETLFYRSPLKNLSKRDVDGKKHIVFVSYYPHIGQIKKSLALKKRGGYHTSMIGLCIREDQEIHRFFDEVYEAEDYREVFSLLARCSACAVHAVTHPFMTGISALAAKAVTGVKTLMEVNDFYYYIEHDKDSLNCRIEKYFLEQADMFTHRMPDESIELIRRAWNIKTPDAQHQPLPEPAFFSEAGDDAHEERLVFAGGVVPYDIAMSRGHEGHVFDPLIKGLCESDRFSLDFYVNRNARNMFWEEHGHYFELENQYPRFRFKKGVPFFRLPQVLSGYGYGVYYENYRMSSFNKDHFTYNMATKLFSYLEAGLPLLVPTHAAYMKSYAEEAGIAVIYDADRVDEIPRLVREADYPGLKRNVTAFREAHSMDHELERVEALYS